MPKAAAPLALAATPGHPLLACLWCRPTPTPRLLPPRHGPAPLRGYPLSAPSSTACSPQLLAPLLPSTARQPAAQRSRLASTTRLRPRRCRCWRRSPLCARGLSGQRRLSSSGWARASGACTRRRASCCSASPPPRPRLRRSGSRRSQRRRRRRRRTCGSRGRAAFSTLPPPRGSRWQLAGGGGGRGGLPVKASARVAHAPHLCPSILPSPQHLTGGSAGA